MKYTIMPNLVMSQWMADPSDRKANSFFLNFSKEHPCRNKFPSNLGSWEIKGVGAFSVRSIDNITRDKHQRKPHGFTKIIQEKN